MNVLSLSEKNEHKNLIEIRLADSIYSRARGLLFTKPLGPDSGLVLSPCNAVHTFFMTYAIDVYFMDKEKKVVKICKNLKPWRQAICFSAKYVLETSTYNPVMEGIEVGMELAW